MTGDLHATFVHHHLQKQALGCCRESPACDTHVLAHFHTAGALSAPSLRLPLEGKAIHHSSRVFIRDPRARPEAIPESEKAM